MSTGKAGGGRSATASASGAGGGDAEVEELLLAAQDDLLLKLSVNSHSVSSSSSIDPDLTRRFQALRSNPSAANSIPISSPNPPSDQPLSKEKIQSADCDDEMNKVLGEDLATRFAKLKGGIGSSKAIEIESTISANTTDLSDDQKKDEVEKLMQWAMDAARLNPSHSDDDDDDDDKLEEDDKIDSSEEEEEEEEELKRKEGKNNNKKKWFLF